MPKHCQAKTKDRKPCRAFAQSTSDFCFTHDPNRAAERHRARLIGGYNHQALRQRPFPKCDLTRPIGLRNFIKELIQDTWRLGSSVGRARALAQLIQLQNDVISHWSFPDEDESPFAGGKYPSDARLLIERYYDMLERNADTPKSPNPAPTSPTA